MSITSHRRRFVPSLDHLQSRLVLSGPDVVITPMDPILIGWDDNAPPEVVITPMDPVLIGWGDDTLPSDSLYDTPPPAIDSALAMGDGLIGN